MANDLLRRRTDQEAADASPLRALVVDDHGAYREYVASLVGRFGFTVTACADGTEALVTLAKDPDYHLMVIDCEMPRMGGMSLIGAVRADHRISDIYAILLTGREDVETKISALRTGFDDYIPKSASEIEITAKLSAARRLVSRQRRLDETLRELYGLATRDELTGLFNRRFFFAEAERLLEQKGTVNLVFFDLDDFKRINDTFGHLAGDRILRDLGALFLTRTRSQDLIARYGGDEFVMLVQDLEPRQVEGLTARLAEEITGAQWTFGTETFGISVTTGMACSSLLDHPSIAQLLSAGDRDLYKNKWVRRNPDLDPALYTYDTSRDGLVIEMAARPRIAKANE